MTLRLTGEEICSALKNSLRGTAHVNPTAIFTGVSTDTRTIRANDLFVALKGDRFDGHAFIAQAIQAGATGVVLQSGASFSLEGIPQKIAVFEVENTLTALGIIARHHRRQFTYPIGAITGSNGKTTTKEMVRAILAQHGPSLATEGNLNNEIGVPKTLFRLEEGLTSAVVEMGMNHPGELSRLVSYAEPDCAAITCVGAAHLEGLKSVAAVTQAKGEIFRGLKSGARLVVNLDDPKIVAQAKTATDDHSWLTFGQAENADIQLTRVETLSQGAIAITIRYEGKDYPVELGFMGTHNARNACCAFAMGIALGATPDECCAGLAKSKGWEHRLSLVNLPFGGALIDDCYNANPASMTAGLKTLADLAKSRSAAPIAAVLGDMLELGPAEVDAHRKLGKQAAQLGVQLLVTVGPRSIDTWREFVAVAPRAKAISVPSPDDLTEVERFLRKFLGKDSLLLVKGSRGMRLERIVSSLTESQSSGDH